LGRGPRDKEWIQRESGKGEGMEIERWEREIEGKWTRFHTSTSFLIFSPEYCIVIKIK